MNVSTFLGLLRAETSAAHQRLEMVEVSAKITSPNVSKTDYLTYLQKIYPIHQGVENTVFPMVQPFVTDMQDRYKSPAIKADLAALGSIPTASFQFFDSAYQPSSAFNMGMMYVIEGSTLGGQVILKNIHKYLGGEVAGATHFFNVYHAATSSLWKSFLNDLDAFQQQNNHAEIIAGANYAFQRVYEALISEAKGE